MVRMVVYVCGDLSFDGYEGNWGFEKLLKIERFKYLIVVYCIKRRLGRRANLRQYLDRSVQVPRTSMSWSEPNSGLINQFVGKMALEAVREGVRRPVTSVYHKLREGHNIQNLIFRYIFI